MKSIIALIFGIVALCESCFAETPNAGGHSYLRLDGGMVPAQAAGEYYAQNLNELKQVYGTKERYIAEFCRLANATTDGKCVQPATGQRFALPSMPSVLISQVATREVAAKALSRQVDAATKRILELTGSVRQKDRSRALLKKEMLSTREELKQAVTTIESRDLRIANLREINVRQIGEIEQSNATIAQLEAQRLRDRAKLEQLGKNFDVLKYATSGVICLLLFLFLISLRKRRPQPVSSTRVRHAPKPRIARRCSQQASNRRNEDDESLIPNTQIEQTPKVNLLIGQFIVPAR